MKVYTYPEAQKLMATGGTPNFLVDDLDHVIWADYWCTILCSENPEIRAAMRGERERMLLDPTLWQNIRRHWLASHVMECTRRVQSYMQQRERFSTDADD